MAPMKRNRNRDRKNTLVRRGGKNSSQKAYKYFGGSNGSRIRKRITGLKVETTGGRNRNVKSRKMGAGRYSKTAKDGNRASSDSSELRTKKYIRKALELGLSSGYLILDENSDGQVLRVASDIVQFGRCGEGRSESEEKPDDSTTGGRGHAGRGGGRTTGGKRLATKNGRTNLRKRGRSRTKSPKKPVAQKRRRKRSESRSKAKARIQKRKRVPGAKNDEPSTRKNEDDAADDDENNDEDSEPDTEDNDNKKSSGGNKKLPVAGRPGTIVPDSDNNPPAKAENNNDEKEASGDEGSSEEGDEEDEEGNDQEQREELATEEDPNEDNEEQKADN